jgi:multidrug efflux pump subunit AcrB
VEEMRFQATLALEYTMTGQDRYTTLEAVRSDFADVFNGQAFPYSFQFLYWEEVGIIDTELTRNLIMCGAVIFVIVGILIPQPRVAAFVILSILLSLVEVVGFRYWWGVTISGVSTIYILISVGLTVDYSAHIAHVYTHTTGSPSERAVGALARIGPCVFNAVTSTLLAVMVLSASQSYIFRTFFKALCLVCLIGGAHGLWLLPALLAVFGGTKDEEHGEAEQAKGQKVFDDSKSGTNLEPEQPIVATGTNMTV